MPYKKSKVLQHGIPKVLFRQNCGTRVVDFINLYHKNKLLMSNKVAYLAGLIDGEGYLKVEKSGTIRLVIGMKSKETIEWIYNNFGGNITIQQTSKEKELNLDGGFYVWRMNQGKSLFYLLLLVIPFLVNKKVILINAMQSLINKFAAYKHTWGGHYHWGEKI